VTVQIALLRAINVGGRAKVAMSDLRDVMTALGFAGVRTLLQSGNVVFGAARQSGRALEDALEAAVARTLGFHVDIVVRSAAQWRAIVDSNPFPEEAARDPGHLVLMALKDRPAKRSLDELRAAHRGPEVVRADGSQLYLYYPDGIGRSKLTNALIEKHLACRATGRNWNTVLKLAELARGR
jgi:uncharacterized protein (DUF1697 family)